MPNLPVGTITFLFTDIEGSTTRWEHHPEQMSRAVARHDALLYEIMQAHQGVVFKTVGDAFYIAFSSAVEALEAAIDAQLALLREEWHADIRPFNVRMALHTGEAEQRGHDYFGQSLNRVARVLSSGYGGQILLSRTTLALVRDRMRDNVTFRDLGLHHLKDIQHPVHIFQLEYPGLPADFPPLKTLHLRPTNLPVQHTSCVGREKELAEVSELLLNHQIRLVTLTGSGGVGKTRLCLQVAHDLAASFPDGLWFVELASIRDAGEIGSAILQLLGLCESGKQPLVEHVKAHLDGKTLLIFDSFEQVDKASSFISHLLDTCPRIKILITSRLALQIQREYEYHVSPLALPTPRLELAPDELLAYGAIQLFVQQAQLAKPGFQLTRSNASTVAKICLRLDGLPLAIELAAARIAMFSPPAMLKLLDRQFQLFAGSEKKPGVYQRTLRETIDWSYKLLENEEKIVIEHMAVFRNGCTFEAIEFISNASGQVSCDLLTILSSLINKNLLGQQEGEDGEPRFRVMYIIREYALEQLRVRGRLGDLNKYHAQYYLRLAERISPLLIGLNQEPSLALLEEEHENLQVALQWYITHEEIEDGLRMAEALWRFWWMHGHIDEERESLDRLLSSPLVETMPAPLRTRAFAIASRMASGQNDYEAAARLADQALTIGLNSGDERSSCLAYTAQAEVAFHEGKYEQATMFLEKGLAIQRSLGDKRGIASLLNNLGNVALQRGDLTQAVRYQTESLVLFRQVGDTWAISTVLISLGETERRLQNEKQATLLYEESLQLCRALGYTQGSATSLVSLGNLAQRQGNYTQANKLYRESLKLFHNIGDKVGIAVCLQGLAEIAYVENQLEQATRLFAHAEVTAYAIGTPILQYEYDTHRNTIKSLRAALDHDLFEGLWVTGQSMTLKQATEEALGENCLAK